jgi:hypothetical protein
VFANSPKRVNVRVVGVLVEFFVLFIEHLLCSGKLDVEGTHLPYSVVFTAKAAAYHLEVFVGSPRKLEEVDLARTGVSAWLEKLMSLRALFYVSKLLRGLSCIAQPLCSLTSQHHFQLVGGKADGKRLSSQTSNGSQSTFLGLLVAVLSRVRHCKFQN